MQRRYFTVGWNIRVLARTAPRMATAVRTFNDVRITAATMQPKVTVGMHRWPEVY